MQSRHERKRQRRILITLLIGIAVLFAALIVLFIVDRYYTNRSVAFRTEDADVEIYRAKKWENFVIKGVNMSGDDITQSGPALKNVYAKLFRRLAARDINVIRLDTVFSPEFYRAFFEYNSMTNKPLYLLQGVRPDLQNIRTYRNAYEPRLNADFTDTIRRTIDVIHGKADRDKTSSARTASGQSAGKPAGQVSGKYNLDVSPYVIGYNFLCAAEDAQFVILTNQKNPDVMGFEGDYFYTESAEPYEAWLAAVANFAVSYEQDKYGGPNRLVSWMGWNAAEPIRQVDKSDTSGSQKDNAVAVNIDRIKLTGRFNAGILEPRQLREKFAGYNEF